MWLAGKKTSYGAVRDEDALVVVALSRLRGVLHVSRAVRIPIADENPTARLPLAFRRRLWAPVFAPHRRHDLVIARVFHYADESRQQVRDAVYTQLGNKTHYSLEKKHSRREGGGRVATCPVASSREAAAGGNTRFLLGAAMTEDAVQEELAFWQRKLDVDTVCVSARPIALPNLFLATRPEAVEEFALFADFDAEGCDFTLLAQGEILYHYWSDVSPLSSSETASANEITLRCRHVQDNELEGRRPDVYVLPHDGLPSLSDHVQYGVHEWDPFADSTVGFGSRAAESVCRDNMRPASIAVGMAIQGM